MELEKIKNESVQKFELLKNAANELSQQCISITVTDEVTERLAIQIISKANSFEKQVETKRKELKDPYFQMGKAIDAAAASVIDVLTESIKTGKAAILKYKQEEQRKQQLAAHKIESLRQKLFVQKELIIQHIDKAIDMESLKNVYNSYIPIFGDVEIWGEINTEAQAVLAQIKLYGSAKKQALLNPAKIEVVEQIQETAKEEMKAAVEVIHIEDVPLKQQGIKTIWKFEIMDMTKVPAKFLMVDESKVKEWMKQAREAGSLETEATHFGIRFYPEQSLVIR